MTEIFIALGFLCGVYTADCQFVIINEKYETHSACMAESAKLISKYPASNLYCMDRAQVKQIRRVFDEFETKI